MGHVTIDVLGDFWVAVAGEDVALLLVSRWIDEIGLELSIEVAVVVAGLCNVDFEHLVGDTCFAVILVGAEFGILKRVFTFGRRMPFSCACVASRFLSWFSTSSFTLVHFAINL